MPMQVFQIAHLSLTVAAPCPPPRGHLALILHPPVPLEAPPVPDLTFRCPLDKAAFFTVVPKDAAGNPEAVDGPPTLTAADPTLADVKIVPSVATPMGFDCYVSPKGVVGPVLVTCSADADLLPGDNEVHPISGALTVDFFSPEATTLEIGAPSLVDLAAVAAAGAAAVAAP